MDAIAGSRVIPGSGGVAGAGGAGTVLPVSKDVQPPVLKIGAGPDDEDEPVAVFKLASLGVCWGAAGPLLSADGRGDEEYKVVAPKEAHPGFLYPDATPVDAESADIDEDMEAHPDFLYPLDLSSLEPTSFEEGCVDEGITDTGGFTIFTPAAFAIFRSSFSSLFLSFSFRLSSSSLELRLARWAACMSLKRALW